MAIMPDRAIPLRDLGYLRDLGDLRVLGGMTSPPRARTEEAGRERRLVR